LTPESATRISVSRQLGMLPCLWELKLGSPQFSGNLRHILGDLRAPLESLEMDSCSLLPDDFAFL
ncbi:LRC14 protein, partial [Toxostoma redivivum]|nr:LRC14 protein [Toxostoma redivivum]